jgi:hypothetical protein
MSIYSTCFKYSLHVSSNSLAFLNSPKWIPLWEWFELQVRLKRFFTLWSNLMLPIGRWPYQIPIVVILVGPLSSPNESTWGLGLWGCCYFYVCQFSPNATTLTLGSWPRQGLVKVRAKSEAWTHVSCSWECGRMWWNEPPHSQVNSHFGS